MSRRRRHSIVATTIAAVLSAAMAIPAAAAANPVGDLLNQVSNTVNNLGGGGSGGGSTGGGSAPASADQQHLAGTPPNYVPPEHGTNPHGQGTVGVVDLTPENTTPLPYDPDGGSEDVVVGRSRGEQTGGNYHGHITIASTFLTGEIIGIDTNEGQQDTGPLGPLNDATCEDNGGGNASFSACVAAVNSDTTANGSTNHFRTLGLRLGSGTTGIAASAASSDGNISQSNGCQNAHGASNVTNASVGGVLTATALDSSSDSQACNNGSKSQNNQSSVVGINGEGLGVPVAGCANGTPDSNFTPLLPLVGAVCNADDRNGSQAALPNGVREALDLFVLAVGGTTVGKATTAAAESHAVAPGGSNPPPSSCANPPCNNGGGNNNGENGGNNGEGAGNKGAGAGAGPAGNGNGPSAHGPGKGNLAFTGADLLTLALIGFGVMGTGLSAMAVADRRRRQTA